MIKNIFVEMHKRKNLVIGKSQVGNLAFMLKCLDLLKRGNELALYISADMYACYEVVKGRSNFIYHCMDYSFDKQKEFISLLQQSDTFNFKYVILDGFYDYLFDYFGQFDDVTVMQGNYRKINNLLNYESLFNNSSIGLKCDNVITIQLAKISRFRKFIDILLKKNTLKFSAQVLKSRSIVNLKKFKTFFLVQI